MWLCCVWVLSPSSPAKVCWIWCCDCRCWLWLNAPALVLLPAVPAALSKQMSERVPILLALSANITHGHDEASCNQQPCPEGLCILPCLRGSQTPRIRLYRRDMACMTMTIDNAYLHNRHSCFISLLKTLFILGPDLTHTERK